MTNNPFKAGDVVQMKSEQGPIMTVEYTMQDICGCAWFDGPIHKKADINAAALMLVTGDRRVSPRT